MACPGTSRSPSLGASGAEIESRLSWHNGTSPQRDSEVSILASQIAELGQNIVVEHQRVVAVLRRQNAKLEERIDDARRTSVEVVPHRSFDPQDHHLQVGYCSEDVLTSGQRQKSHSAMGAGLSLTSVQDQHVKGMPTMDSLEGSHPMQPMESNVSMTSETLMSLPDTLGIVRLPSQEAPLMPDGFDGFNQLDRGNPVLPIAIYKDAADLPRLDTARKQAQTGFSSLSDEESVTPSRSANDAASFCMVKRFQEGVGPDVGATRTEDSEPGCKSHMTSRTQGNGMDSEALTNSAFSQKGAFAKRGMQGSQVEVAAVEVQSHLVKPPQGQLARHSSIGELFLRSSNTACFSNHQASRSKVFQIGGVTMTLPSWIGLPVHPNSVTRTVHDALFIIVMLYDSIMQPFTVAWDVEITGPLLVLAWTTSIFWTYDIFMSFVTGFFPASGGSEAEMRFSVIAMRYMRGWFVSDIAMCASDWIALMANSGMVGARLFRALRIMRIMRVIQVASSRRASPRLEGLLDQAVPSDFIKILVTIVKQFFYVCWLNHCGCCLWVAMGKLGRVEQRGSWLDEAEEMAIYGNSGADMYLFGFIWSTSTIMGENNGLGKNVAELVFQAIWLIVGLVFGSLMVSNLAEVMMQLQDQKKEHTRKLKMLRRFLQQQKIESHLSFAIQREIGARMDRSSRLAEQDVPCLDLMSSALRIELRWVRCEQPLLGLPLLRTFQYISWNFMKSLCDRAVTYEFHRPGESVFQLGHTAIAAYRVVYGRLEYAQGTYEMPDEVSHEFSQKAPRRSVRPPSWVSMQVLFLNWEHVGLLEAQDNSEIVTLSTEGFATTCHRTPELLPLAKSYAESVCKRCNELGAQYLSDIEDDSFRWSNHGLVVLTMQADHRTKMAKACMEALRVDMSWLSRISSGKGSWQELKKEVKLGKSAVVYDDNSRIVRVVSVVVLQLERDDGMVMAQVGKYDPKTEKITDIRCVHPGKKVKGTETPLEALRDYMQLSLEPFKDTEIESQEVLVEEKDSPAFPSLQTSYLKTVCTTTVTEDEWEKESDRRMILRERPTRLLAARIPRRITKAKKAVEPEDEPMEAFCFAPEAETVKKEDSAQQGPKRLPAGDSTPRREKVKVEKSKSAEAETVTVPVLMWVSPMDFNDFQTREGESALHDWLTHTVRPTQKKAGLVSLIPRTFSGLSGSTPSKWPAWGSQRNGHDETLDLNTPVKPIGAVQRKPLTPVMSPGNSVQVVDATESLGIVPS